MNFQNGILIINNEEWSTDTSCNTEEPEKVTAKWKKLATEDHIFHEPKYVKCPE